MTTPKTDAAYQRLREAWVAQPAWGHIAFRWGGAERTATLSLDELLDQHLLEVATAREAYLRTLMEEYYCQGLHDIVLVEDRSKPLETTFSFRVRPPLPLAEMSVDGKWLMELLDAPANEPTEAMMRASARRRELFGE